MSKEDEFEKEYNKHLDELRSRGFTDNFIETEKSSKWLPKTWFFKGYNSNQEKLDAAIALAREWILKECYCSDDISCDFHVFLNKIGVDE